MPSTRCVIIIFLVHLYSVSYGADILAILPTPSYSHQIPFRPLWKALAARGHNITLVTSDPERNASIKNIKEIDISYGYEYIDKYKCIELACNDSVSLIDVGRAIRLATADINERFLKSPEGQNLIHNKDNHFDLLIVEALLIDMMAFSWKYKIPFIGVSSLDCSTQFHDSAGNPTHPVVNPDPNLEIQDLNDMSFGERLASFLFSATYKLLVYYLTYRKEYAMLQKYFGDDLPRLFDIQNEISMLFVATNPVFHNVRALMPNTITIGNGMHISSPKPLPKDIEEWLNSSKEDVVYFSLGSNIKGSILNDSTKAELTKAFSSLPYKVLWKIDHQVNDLPKNVLIKKWLPQQDILRHPKVKVFITQGGLQSMQESIYFDKPMIGIPFFGDQHMNVKRMTHLGYGVKVHKNNITRESISEAVIEVITNPIYREKAEIYGNIFRDTDIPNVDKAVWWTEYTLRHNGTRQFRNPALDMPFWKYWMLDVLGIVFGVLFIFSYLSLKFVKLILRRIFRRNGKQIDKSKKWN